LVHIWALSVKAEEEQQQQSAVERGIQGKTVATLRGCGAGGARKKVGGPL